MLKKSERKREIDRKSEKEGERGLMDGVCELEMYEAGI